MSKSKIIEIVLFEVNEGVDHEQFRLDMAGYNNFLKESEGFLSRKIGVAEDGQYIDIMYFADINACKACAERAEKDGDLIAFQLGIMDTKINQSSVYSSRFKVFNQMPLEAVSNPTIAEIFIMKPTDDVDIKVFESAMIKFNDTLANYEGLVLRENGVTEDGQYMELVYWTGLDAINLANETVVQVESAEIESFFEMTDEESEIINRFKVFMEL